MTSYQITRGLARNFINNNTVYKKLDVIGKKVENLEKKMNDMDTKIGMVKNELKSKIGMVKNELESKVIKVEGKVNELKSGFKILPYKTAGIMCTGVLGATGLTNAFRWNPCLIFKSSEETQPLPE
ncbi:hypothetical protein RhiirA5_435055 [Rhizophagus irregularis]|uniref:DUF1664 domain-containing protein n=1 Tax=Rhizophagus irregularis TaxID=588596 RepID=A0A2N0R7Y5_9GLOM|nr:hypothetical protein RhiirA5_435055 [Rhizophagus irregularis]PKC59423.1 hypothetical protein RhiirA1_469466 [Rhizophagus irregularis]CAB4471665.1 unnamed protein product [Rhizophagus irregularis]